MAKDDGQREDKPKPVKRPAKPRAVWLVPNGIAWTGDDGEIRHKAGAKLAAGDIPDDLALEYAGRGDIIKLTPSEGN